MTTNPNLASLEPLGRFRSDLVVEPQKKDGAVAAYRVLDPNSNVSHVLTELEYAVATCMNGERNVMEVARQAARLGHPVQPDHVERFHRELEGLSFVYRDQPPTLTRAPDLSHRDDAKRFVEEAKRELALGRLEVARDLLDAALAIDRVTATNAATGTATAPPPVPEKAPEKANPSDAIGPVLDYLKDWDVPAPPPLPSNALAPASASPAAAPDEQTGATSRWTPPTLDALPPIDINLDDAAPVVGAASVPVAAKRSHATRWLAAAAAIVLVVAGAGAISGLTDVLPDGVLAFPEALASTSAPSVVAPTPAPLAPAPAPAPVPVPVPVASAPAPAPADAIPVVAIPVVAPPPAVVVESVVAPEDEAVAMVAGEAKNVVDTDVVAPSKGKFMRALVMSGLKVKEGQRIAILAAPNGKQMVLTAPAAGIFEATAPLGKTVRKGDVVGVVHAW